MQGKSFVHHDISSPVVHDITMCIVLVLMLMGKLAAHLVDVNGAFLLGHFKPEEQIYMKVPKGFENFYPIGGLLFCNELYMVLKCSKSFLEITFGYYGQIGICAKLSRPMFVLQMGSKTLVDCLAVIYQ